MSPMTRWMPVSVVLSAATVAALLVTGYSPAAEPSASGEYQYEFGDVAIPKASADEPVLPSFSRHLAERYLEQGTRAWNGEHQCVTCHTNGTYMVTRPALTASLGKPPEATYDFFLHALDELREEPPDRDDQSVERLKTYLQTEAPPHDYAKTLLLRAATRMDGLLTSEQKNEIVERLWSHQRADGGWSIRTFARPDAWGSGNRAEKLESEPDIEDPASDGHMTGLAIIALREAGVPANDERIVRGLAWLKSNQRESGRWWTRSLNTDSWHSITYSGTAFALLAFQMCDAEGPRTP